MEIDRRREVRGITEAAGFVFDAHDLAVETFGHTVGDRVRDKPKHAREMTFECGRDVLHGLEPRPNRPPVPAREEPPHRRRLAVGPQGAEGFFDRPRATDFQIQGLECSERFLMAFGPALLAEQPQVRRAGQRRVATLAKKRAVLLLADRCRRLSSCPA